MKGIFFAFLFSCSLSLLTALPPAPSLTLGTQYPSRSPSLHCEVASSPPPSLQSVCHHGVPEAAAEASAFPSVPVIPSSSFEAPVNYITLAGFSSKQSGSLPVASFVSAFPPACSLVPGSRRMSPGQFLCSCALLPSEPVPGVSGFLLIIDNISSRPCIQLLYLYSEISQASQVCVPSYIHFFLFADSQLSVFSGQGGRGLWERSATESAQVHILPPGTEGSSRLLASHHLLKMQY